MDTTQIIAAFLSIGLIGAILGAVLAYASKVFHVEVDPKVEKIMDILPQANCAACGYTGCSKYAEEVVENGVAVNLCTPGGQDVIDQIASIMGVEATTGKAMVAYVACNGSKENAKDRFEYYGPKSCSSAVFISGGHKACDYGCLGFGECVEACNFDAMYMDEETGLPVVIDEKCVGCGACVRACPKDVMKMMPKDSKVFIACNSKAKGKEVSDACKVGCIGCKICALPKTTPSGAIKMEGDLPVINFDIADDLVAAKFKCPKSCFEDKGDAEKTTEEIAKEKADFKAVEAEKTAAAKKAALEKAAAAKAAKEAEGNIS
ncbi:MAG: RnfABCDGE type electron transport complex subunit B [Candidatus Delongbacteria bacterium]|nr:RnfABCDGE type electron transport complex subunit B [Candidatus Delongbacteria bacterium]